MENVENKNPECNGTTPLFIAASKGHFEICKLIIENVEDKNPEICGTTPLSIAVLNGHFEICKLIIENVEDKNPIGEWDSCFKILTQGGNH